MPAPLLPIVLGMAQFAPHLVRFFGAGDTATGVAERVAQVAQAVTGAPDAAGALQRLREDASAAAAFQQRVLEIDAELEQAHLADRADARQRDVALASAGRRNVRADVMVALDVVGLVACLLVLCVYRSALPGEAVGIISTIAGIFGACLRDAHQFEFGSSRGSRDKDEALANALSSGK